MPLKTIQEFKSEYPEVAQQYPDDMALAQDLHKRFAPDMDFQSFVNETKPEMGTFEKYVERPLSAGYQRGEQALNVLGQQLGYYTPEEAATRIRENIRETPVQAPSVAEGMEDISGAETYGEAAMETLKNPGAVAGVIGQSVGQYAPGLAAAGAAAIAPVPGARAVGVPAILGAYGGSQEFAGTIQEVAREQGYNPADPESMREFVEDDNAMEIAQERGAKRGIPIAMFDALSAGLAGRIAGPVAKTVGGRTGNVAGATAEVGAQAGAGAGGEYTAQQLTGEDRPGDVVIEGVAELGPGAAEIAMGARRTRAQKEADKARRAERRGDALPEEAIRREREAQPTQVDLNLSEVRARQAADRVGQTPRLPSPESQVPGAPEGVTFQTLDEQASRNEAARRGGPQPPAPELPGEATAAIQGQQRQREGLSLAQEADASQRAAFAQEREAAQRRAGQAEQTRARQEQTGDLLQRARATELRPGILPDQLSGNDKTRLAARGVDVNKPITTQTLRDVLSDDKARTYALKAGLEAPEQTVGERFRTEGYDPQDVETSTRGRLRSDQAAAQRTIFSESTQESFETEGRVETPTMESLRQRESTRQANRDRAVNEINDWISRRYEGKGKQKQQIADDLRRLMQDPNQSADEVIVGFAAAETLGRVLPENANVRTDFLREVFVGKEAAERSGGTGEQAAGKFKPLEGVVEIATRQPGKSLDAQKQFARESAAHEGFHALQQIYKKADPKADKVLETVFPSGKKMTLDQVDPRIKGFLQRTKSPDTGKTYWDSLQFDGQDMTGEEVAAHTFGAWVDAQRRGESTGLPNPVKRFFGFVSKQRERMGNALRGLGYQTPEDIFKRSAEGRAPGAEARVEETDLDEQGAVERVMVGQRQPREARAYRSPSLRQLSSVANKSPEKTVRYFRDNDGKLWAWDAMDAIHYEMADALGIDPSEIRSTGEVDAEAIQSGADRLRRIGYDSDALKRWRDQNTEQAAAMRNTGLSENEQRVLREAGVIAPDTTPAQYAQTWMQRGLKRLLGAPDQFVSDHLDDADAFTTQVVNFQHPIKAIEKKVRGALAKGWKSPFKAMEMAQKTSGRMEQLLQEGLPVHVSDQEGRITFDQNKKSFLQVLEQVPIKDQPRLEAYMKARRAQELRAEGRENFFNDEFIETGLSYGSYQLPNGQTIADVGQEFQGMFDHMVDFAQQGGVFTQDQAEALKSYFYVPFYRVRQESIEQGGSPFPEEMMNDINAVGKQGGIKNPSERIERLKGGSEPVGPLIDNALGNMEMMMHMTLHNVAMNQAAGLLQESGDGRYVVGDAAKDAPNVVSFQAAEDMVLEVDDAASLYGKRQGKRRAQFKKGETVQMSVPDNLVWNALSGYSSQQLTSIGKVLAFFTRMLRAGVTITPAFMFNNMLRGDQSAFVTHPNARFKPVIDSLRGIKQWMRNEENAKAIQSITGIGNYHLSSVGGGNTEPQMAKVVRRELRIRQNESILNIRDRSSATDFLGRMHGLLQNIAEGSEMGARVGIYNAVLKETGDKGEAAYQADNVVNFSRRGLGQAGAGKLLTQLFPMVPFMNARVQGLYKHKEAWDENPKGMALRMSMLAMISAGLWAAQNDDERWDEEPDWRKQMYWSVYLGDHTFMIPKGFESALPATMVEYFLDNLSGDRDMGDSASMIGSSVWNTLGLNPIPQGIKPGLEVITNYSFFKQGGIETRGEQRLPADMRYDADTPELAKWASQGISTVIPGVSPKDVVHLIRGYTGSAGMVVVNGIDANLEQWGGLGPTPPGGVLGSSYSARLVNSVFDVGRNLKRKDLDLANRYIGEFYDMKREANSTYQAIRTKIEQGAIEEAREIAQNNRGSLAVRGTLNDLGQRLTQLNNAMDQIRYADLTPEEKTDKLAILRQRYNRIVNTSSRIRERIDQINER